jgi:hypothetical protein
MKKETRTCLGASWRFVDPLLRRSVERVTCCTRLLPLTNDVVQQRDRGQSEKHCRER